MVPGSLVKPFVFDLPEECLRQGPEVKEMIINALEATYSPVLGSYVMSNHIPYPMLTNRFLNLRSTICCATRCTAALSSRSSGSPMSNRQQTWQLYGDWIVGPFGGASIAIWFLSLPLHP